jgi:hypothetical protein
MIIKQTFRNHIKVLWIAIFTTILYAVVLWFFRSERGALIIFLSGYVLTVVPSFYIHISYAIKNKGMVCQILPGKICIVKNGKEQVIQCSDIEDITVYKSASIEKGGIPITPMEAYFFVRIIDKGGNKYDLTCLMDTNIDKSIKIIGAIQTFVERGVFNTL